MHDAKVEYTDRYDAMGIPYPNPQTMCEGHCEGTGVVPVFMNVPTRKTLCGLDETDPELIARWQMKHANGHGFRNAVRIGWKVQKEVGGGFFERWRSFWFSYFDAYTCDGWHFVKCPDCHGTGIKLETKSCSCPSCGHIPE